jgi:C4-dicarboxylate-specific signal transduction histidine kinase
MTRPAESSRNDFLRLKLGLTAALSVMILGWLSWESYRDYRWTDERLSMVVRLHEIRTDMIRLEEFLTSSARMAAGSGDPQWEARYREVQPQLDSVIKEAVQMAPDRSHGAAADKTDAANNALVGMHRRAFELVRLGKHAEAIELLSSGEHEAERKIYARGVADIHQNLLRASDSMRAELRDELRRSAIMTIVAVVLLILGSGFVFRVTRRWQASIVDGNRELNRKSVELEALNGRLDKDVAERTRELSDSVMASMNMMEDAVRERENAELAYSELEKTHDELLEASRQRGRAEVATNVLHNVGNVLNSVNVSASLVVENIKGSRAGSMVEVAALLREHEADLGSYITSDPKGRHIPAFLQQLAHDWLAQQEIAVKELQSLSSNIDHIREIVVMQQSHAKVVGSAETVNIRDLVEDSLRMNADGLLEQHLHVVRQFEDVAPVSVEKHKVLQILVNLVRNAKHACDGLEAAKKRMTLRIAQVHDRIRISVSDNGAGIAPENLTRIFAHGFTTRKDGHGFGLHSGALAAAELGGSLSAHSDGPGKGATFTLELAAQPQGDA